MKVEDRKQAAGAGEWLMHYLVWMVYFNGCRTVTGTAAKHTAKRMYDPVREASRGLGN